MTIVLVRHAESARAPEVPSAQWGLSSDGHAQAKGLVDRLLGFEPGVVLAGPEPRMGQTVAPLADALGLGVVIDDGIAESHAGGWLDDAAFAVMVEAFFARPDAAPALGWEPAEAAATRFIAAIETIAARSEANVVACSGGRVITAALCRLGALDRDAALATWRSLATPEVLVLGRAAGRWRLTNR